MKVTVYSDATVRHQRSAAGCVVLLDDKPLLLESFRYATTHTQVAEFQGVLSALEFVASVFDPQEIELEIRTDQLHLAEKLNRKGHIQAHIKFKQPKVHQVVTKIKKALRQFNDWEFHHSPRGDGSWNTACDLIALKACGDVTRGKGIPTVIKEER